MRKIPYPVERKILQPLIDSDHEVMMTFQSIIKKSWIDNKEVDGMELLIKSWVDDLQEMYDKAEVVDDLEHSLNQADNLLDVTESELRTAWETLSEVRRYTNV